MGTLTYPTRAETVIAVPTTAPANPPYPVEAKRSIIALRCDVGTCQHLHLPYATIEAGKLHIRVRHNGETHTMTVPDEIVLQLAAMILLRQMMGG